MKITISNTANEPLYQQIMEQIKENILSGELQEGELLPSIRSFANDLKVSVLTIRRVYEELEKEGFVVSQVGLGTFVKAGNTELFRESKRRMIEEKLTGSLETGIYAGYQQRGDHGDAGHFKRGDWKWIMCWK